MFLNTKKKTLVANRRYQVPKMIPKNNDKCCAMNGISRFPCAGVVDRELGSHVCMCNLANR